MDENDLVNRPLFVMHIPKTAGTSLVWVLMHQVAPDTMYKVYPGEWHQFVALREQARVAVPRLVVGHFRFGLHEGVSPNARYFTLFRDPVDRVVSHFNHLIASDEPGHRAILQPSDSIREFLKHEWARNLQTQYVTNLSAQEIEEDPETAYQLAVRNLHEHFTCFGVAERFSESLQPLVARLRGRMPRIPRLNTSRGLTRHHLSREDFAQILKANACDDRLHVYAGSVLRANRWQRRGQRWGWLTRAFERYARPFLPGARANPVATPAVIDYKIRTVVEVNPGQESQSGTRSRQDRGGSNTPEFMMVHSHETPE